MQTHDVWAKSLNSTQMKHTWELESKASIISENNFEGNFLFSKKQVN